MENINTISVTEDSQFEDLYKDSALTIERLEPSQKNLNAVFNWLEEHTEVKTRTAYVITGKIMNYQYGLTGDNAYPNDLNIVCIKLSDMVSPLKITIPRFDVGGRWFDDVVDNNARRESRKANGWED